MRRANLPSPTARARLRDLITYGPIGLLRRTAWPEVIDSRLFARIELLKVGFLDGVVKPSALVSDINALAQQLQLAPLSPQLILSLFNSIPKQRRNHGGDAEILRGIHQRATLVSARPRLHHTWLVLPLRLDFPQSAAHPHLQRATFFAVLVVERATRLPMGCWVSPTEPDTACIGLALYDAIWHPARLDWPLRGIPEVIQLAASFRHLSLDDIRRAASDLRANVELLDHQPLSKSGLVLRLRREGVQQIAARLRTGVIGAQSIYEAVLDWLMGAAFAHHRAPLVRRRFREHGVALPGHQTAAAGWLLPIHGAAKSQRNAVSIGPRTYADAAIRIDPGQRLPYRRFPYFYKSYEDGIFVELSLPNALPLPYLPVIDIDGEYDA